MSLFPHRINYIHDGIMSMQVWKLYNEVYTDDIPAILWDGERVKLSSWTMPLNLSPKAEVTCLSILTNVVGHLWPLVVAGDKFQCLPAPSMSSNFGVMAL